MNKTKMSIAAMGALYSIAYDMGYGGLINESRIAQAEHDKQMGFLCDYYQTDSMGIGEMRLSLDNMELKQLYDLTLAGHEYQDGVMLPPKPVTFDSFGLTID